MPTTYAETWFPVLVQIIIALGVAGAMIGLSALIGRRVRDTVKSTPYESGMKPVGNARERFSVKFYLRDLNKSARFFPFFDMLLFIVLVLCGFFYIWKKGVLNWSTERPVVESAPEETKRAA